MKNAWEQLARLDPLYFVLTDPEQAGGGWDPERFFEDGRQSVRDALQQLEALGVQPKGGRALDFGCGPGRLTQALGESFERVDGVDASPRMIELAREYDRLGGRCHYHVNDRPDLALFPDGAFDFVCSMLVLHHLPQKRQLGYLREFVRVLEPGGIAYFQLSVFPPGASRAQRRRRRLKELRRRILHKQHIYYLLSALGVSPGWLRERLGLRPRMGMFTLDEDVLRGVLEASGAQVVHAGHGQRRGRANGYFVVRKRSA